MIKNRNLTILAVVLVALIAVSLLQKFSHRRATSRPAAASLLTTDLDRESLMRIALGFGADSTAVVLERLPDGWVARTAWNMAVSQQRVDDLLKSLGDLAGEYRSGTADVLGDYGLQREQAVSIKLFGRDFQPVLDLLVGKQPMGQVGNFVRRPGDANVYLTRASLLVNLGLYSGPARPATRHFLNLEAYKGVREDVDAILVEDGTKAFEVVKVFPNQEPAAVAPGDSTAPAGPDRTTFEWKMTRPKAKAALKTKCDALLSAATMVRAADVAEPGKLMEYGLWKAERKVTLRTKDGKTFTLYFGAARPEAPDQPGGVYMRTDADNTMWVVRESLVSSLFVKPEDLLSDS